MAQLTTKRMYMPGLDGVRALAVLAVVAYHLYPSALPGGFLGVDVFFVLSGYLITTLLLHEYDTTGEIQLTSFWKSRFRRLLPALLMMVSAVFIYVLLIEPSLLKTVQEDLAASLFYMNNWWYIFQDVSYFESFGKPSPVQNLWSLAIEGQFYIIWPTLLAVGLAFRKHLPRLLVIGIALSSLAMAGLYTEGSDPSRVYYGTDTRVFALLVGAWLAFYWTPERIQQTKSLARRLVLNGIGVLSLFTLGWFTLHLDEYDPFLYRGGFLLTALMTAALVMSATASGSVVSRMLRSQFLRYIGQRSYGIYLWHYPIIVLSTPLSEVGTLSWPRLLTQIALTVVLAELSYRWIETPIRRNGFLPTLRALGRHNTHIGTAQKVSAVTILTAFLFTSVGNITILAFHEPAPVKNTIHVVEAPTASTKPNMASTETKPETPTETVTESVDEPLTCPKALAIGDSVLLGLNGYLGDVFPNMTIDAEIGRQLKDADTVATSYESFNAEGHVVFLHLGTNGDFKSEQLETLLSRFEHASRIYIINTRVPRPWESTVNEKIADAAETHDNVDLIDWNTRSEGHEEYFSSDAVHLNVDGAKVFARMLNEQLGCELSLED